MNKFIEAIKITPIGYTKDLDKNKILNFEYSTSSILINTDDISTCRRMKLYNKFDVDVIIMNNGQKLYIKLGTATLYDKIKNGEVYERNY